MTRSLHQLIDIAADIAEQTGKLVLDAQHEAHLREHARTVGIEAACATDKAAEEYIVSRILVDCPEDAILGEEGTARVGSTNRRWIVDPIDGTTNFVRDAMTSAISIGIEIDGQFAVGVVYNPFTNELYKAATGLGAYLNDARLAIRLEDIVPTKAIIGLAGGYRERARLIRAEVARRAIQQAGDLRYSGSPALDFCHVASGQLDAAFGCGMSIWDVAAGTVIAREAGCVSEGAKHDTEPNADYALTAAVSYVGDFRRIVHTSIEAQAAPVTSGYHDRDMRAWPARHSDW